MGTTFFVANWKSHKTENEAKVFLDRFSEKTFSPNKKIILCPPTTLLGFVKKYIEEKNMFSLEVGAQNISEFSEGPYTGEENARQISDFASYVIIGHSERRKLFGENDETIIKKAKVSLGAGLIPIICVENDLFPLRALRSEILMVAYEPISAIGSGKPDDPKNASNMASKIKEIGKFRVLYGGSVNPGNVSSFTRADEIDGVFVGGGSLSPEEFSAIVENG